MSSSKPIIAVVGATGVQGGSVVKTFLELESWQVRGLTRDSASAASQQHAAKGAEMVTADLSDLDAVRAAFQGATAIFANTDYWVSYRNPGAPEKAKAAGKTLSQYASDQEGALARNIAIAANDTDTLERFVYSALSPIREVSRGKYLHGYHWDSKGAIVKMIRTDYPKLAAKMSIVQLGAYFPMMHLHPMFQPQIDVGTNSYRFYNTMSPTARLAYIDAPRSTGLFVHVLITTEPVNTNLLAYDSELSYPEVCDILTRITGRPAEFISCTIDEADAKLRVGKDILEILCFVSDYGYAHGFGHIEPASKDEVKRPHDLKSWNELKGKLASLEHWMEMQDWEPAAQGVEH